MNFNILITFLISFVCDILRTVLSAGGIPPPVVTEQEQNIILHSIVVHCWRAVQYSKLYCTLIVALQCSSVLSPYHTCIAVQWWIELHCWGRAHICLNLICIVRQQKHQAFVFLTFYLLHSLTFHLALALRPGQVMVLKCLCVCVSVCLSVCLSQYIFFFIINDEWFFCFCSLLPFKTG